MHYLCLTGSAAFYVSSQDLCDLSACASQDQRPFMSAHRIFVICASQDQRPFMSAHRIYVILVPVPHRINGLLCQLAGFL